MTSLTVTGGRFPAWALGVHLVTGVRERERDGLAWLGSHVEPAVAVFEV